MFLLEREAIGFWGKLGAVARGAPVVAPLQTRDSAGLFGRDAGERSATGSPLTVTPTSSA